MKQRGEFYEFVQCLETVQQYVGPGMGGDHVNCYENSNWVCFGPQMMDEFKRIMNDVDLDTFDLLKPVRDRRFVASELTHGQATVDLLRDILGTVSCELCHGVCRETMTVKECAHRFCNECIQRWIRKGHTTCPVCPHVKVPSRRVLRPNSILDEIIAKLLPDLEKLPSGRPRAVTSTSDSNDSSSSSEEEGMVEDDTSEAEDDEEEEDDEEDEDEDDDESDESDEGEKPRGRRGNPGGRRAPMMPPAMMMPPGGPLSQGPNMMPTMMKSAYGQNLDELYADDMGYLEIFLVCLNNNLPSAVCSMARELSKRPMKLPVGATTRDAAMILAEKLVRDVLGPFDVHSIITDLSFVRDGDIWPAVSQVPLSEVCRQVTESRGPIALRYLLSDRLYSLCERIEASY